MDFYIPEEGILDTVVCSSVVQLYFGRHLPKMAARKEEQEVKETRMARGGKNYRKLNSRRDKKQRYESDEEKK
jgi:hypothetical protein